MGNLNKWFGLGRLTRDPELRSTPNGTQLCEFGFAVNRDWKDKDGEKREETLFIDVTMWGKRAAVINEYVHKGSEILIEGRLQLDQWEQEGQKRSKIVAIAEDFQFVGGRDESAPSQSTESRRDVGDDEIPF